MVLIFVNYLNLIGIEIEAAQRESLKRAGQKKKKAESRRTFVICYESPTQNPR